MQCMQATVSRNTGSKKCLFSVPSCYVGLNIWFLARETASQTAHTTHAYSRTVGYGASDCDALLAGRCLQVAARADWRVDRLRLKCCPVDVLGQQNAETFADMMLCVFVDGIRIIVRLMFREYLSVRLILKTDHQFNSVMVLHLWFCIRIPISNANTRDDQ